MIERFHHSLKSALRSRLASSDWFLHLSFVLLVLRIVPKDDTGLSVSEAVPGDSLEVLSCLPPPTSVRSSKLWLVSPFLRLSCSTVSSSSAPSCLAFCKFCVCLRRCLCSFSSTLVPRSLPGTWVERQVLPPSDWFQDSCCFCQSPQICVFWWTCLTSYTSSLWTSCYSSSGSYPPPLVVLDLPSAAPPVVRPERRVPFQLSPSVPAHRNPCRAVQDRRICSAISPPLLLGGVLWQVDVRQSIPTADTALSTNSWLQDYVLSSISCSILISDISLLLSFIYQ